MVKKFLVDLPVGTSGKEPTGQCRSIRVKGSIPGSGSSPGGGHGNPLQYSCLKNPRDRGAWWATVHGVAQSRTRLSDSAGTQRHTKFKSITMWRTLGIEIPTTTNTHTTVSICGEISGPSSGLSALHEHGCLTLFCAGG